MHTFRLVGSDSSDQHESMEAPSPASAARSWSGVAVIYIGKTADVGGRTLVIGQECPVCDYGRITLRRGVVQCSICQQQFGPFQRFLDAGVRDAGCRLAPQPSQQPSTSAT
jgi:hypothetical protein